MGNMRRIVVLIIRSLVLLGLILAMAEIQFVRTSDRLTTIFLLDQSLSIPVQSREAMIKYVNTMIKKYRKNRDRVGVIVFGRDAAIEIPPYDDNVQMASKIESMFDPEYTNLAAAMKLAQASFPEDAAKRIVIISDGNQNLGNAAEQAQGLMQAGVGIDVMPVFYQARAEIIVERVAIPPDVRRGQPFDLRVVITNTAAPQGGDSGEVRGRLVLSRSAGGRTDVLSDEPVTFTPRQKSIYHPPGNRHAEFLQLRSPLHPRPPRRRRHAAKQSGHGFYVRARQRPRAAGRGRRTPRRIRSFNRTLAQARAGNRRSIHQSTLYQPRRTAALRCGSAGRRAPRIQSRRGLQRRPNRHARAKYAADGRGPGNDRRAEQFRRRRLGGHRIGKGHARGFPNQVGQGCAQRRLGNDHARQRNGRRQLLAKGNRPRGRQSPRPARLLRSDTLERHGTVALGARTIAGGPIPRSDACPPGPHDPRRYAQFRACHGPGQAGIRQSPHSGHQAHDYHQRRRSFAAQSCNHQQIKKYAGYRLHRGRGNAWAAGKSTP